ARHRRFANGQVNGLPVFQSPEPPRRNRRKSGKIARPNGQICDFVGYSKKVTALNAVFCPIRSVASRVTVLALFTIRSATITQLRVRRLSEPL
ncbi:MAG: hypothetical protein IJH04_01230, partial [Eggerthellaceae bacterium]|nr:hypothetical protein [Eggerthellaceae bacterium]